ncbi:MAG: ATP-binding cassette domain-containing protein [Elusimicrobia bacterium]|nr:ATP-binding cassette domain-containing protein [Elusimicrobiota bacterium]
MAAAFLQFDNVTVNRGPTAALRGLTLTLREGEGVAIIGPNGSGKSTLVKAITRECYPYDGELRVFGRASWDVFELRDRLGIVTQDLQRANETNVAGRDIPGLEAVLSGFFSSVGVWDDARVTKAMVACAKAALKRVGAAHLANRPLTEMSSGEARRVMIARALAHEPRALVLDEPTNSLDLAALDEFLSLIRRIARRGTDLVLVTHHLHDVVPEIRRVVLLKNGRVFRDGPKGEVLTSATLSRLFDRRVMVEHRDGWYDVRAR